MNTIRKRRDRFIPALSYHFLTLLYDSVMRTLLRETRFKSHLMALAEIESGRQVLDVGCGMTTLTLLLKRQYPDTNPRSDIQQFTREASHKSQLKVVPRFADSYETTVIGLDADPEALMLARKKLARSHLQVTLDEGTATALPYADASFDRVLSSLLISSALHKVRSVC